MHLSKLDTILNLIDEAIEAISKTPLVAKLNTPKTRNTLLGTGYALAIVSPLLGRYKFLSWVAMAVGVISDIFNWLLGGRPTLQYFEPEEPVQLEFPFMKLGSA